jgi:hypothetical protein
MDLNSAKRMIKHCNDDGRRLEDFDPSALLFTLKQLVREVEKLWALNPEHAPSSWAGRRDLPA